MRYSREELEALALEVVDVCLYYDLVDTIQETTDEELIDIIEKAHTPLDQLE
jgi:hypothetical protein